MNQPADALGVAGRRAALGAFFCSGAAGVMHEVVWSRQLVRLIGAESHAQAVSLAVFMAGLAAGALLARRRADGEHPLRDYARLEVLIAAYALLIPLLLAAAGAGYLALARALFPHAAAGLAIRFALTMLVVAPPAILMGATLPLLAAAVARGSTAPLRGKLSALYAANCAGAVAGTATAGFLALPLTGIWGALALAAAANLAAAALVARFVRRQPPAVPIEPAPSWPDRPVPAIPLFFALGLSGLCAMGYEVLFVRVVALAMGSSAHAFTVMLIAFITGIAAGSALLARLRIQSSPRNLAVCQLATVVAFVAATPLLARLPYLIDVLRVRLQHTTGGFQLHLLLSALLFLAVLLVPTALLGFAFPIVADLQARRGHRTGASVGAAYAASTAGNVAGVFLTSLALLPRLGLERSFSVLWILQVAAALALLIPALQRPFVAAAVAGRRWLVPLALAITAAVATAHLLRGRGWTETLTLVPDHFLLREGPRPDASPAERARHPSASLAAWRRRYLLPDNAGRFEQILLAEDAHVSAVAFGPDRRQGGTCYLAVNNKTDASTRDDLETQLLLGHAPMFLVPRARTALVIGHGVGITAGAVLRHQPQHLDLVEISPAVLRLDPLFANENDYVLTDPRVSVHVDDGQSFVRATPTRYDVIISEPSNPWIAGIGDLFTVDFFRAVRDKLAPGGAFTFWFHTYAQTDDTTRLLLRSLGAVFSHVQLFSDSQIGNIIAVAAIAPLPLDFARAEQRFADPAVSRDLERIQVPSLAALLTLHRRTQAFPWPEVGPGPVNTSAHERLRYAAPRALFFGWSSFFIEQHDPLLLDAVAGTPPTASLFEQYVAWRASRGDPMRAIEYETAADWIEPRSGYGPAIAARLRARAETAPTTR